MTNKKVKAAASKIKRKTKNIDIEDDPFVQRLKAIRIKLGLSQRGFASAVGTTGAYQSELEAGHSKPGYHFIRNAYRELRISPLYLLTGEGPMIMLKSPDEETGNVLDYFLSPDGTYKDDFSPLMLEMIRYCQQSQTLKLAILEFFKRYLFENRRMIEAEINTGPGETPKPPVQ